MKIFSTFRRIFCILLIMSMLMSLAGCKQKASDPGVTPTAEPTAAPTPDAGSETGTGTGDSSSNGLLTPDTDTYPVDASGEVLINDVDLSNYTVTDNLWS